MILPKGLVFFSNLLVLSCASFKGPSGVPWASFASKPVYTRALGPPVSEMDTITVPYMPKSPFFPKFVDPKIIISKKTDMLSNLFGGLGPAYPTGFKPLIPYAASGSTLYSTTDGTSLLSKNNVDDGASSYKRGIFGPFGSKPFGPMSPKFGPMSPFSSLNVIPDYSTKDEFSRKKRSIDESAMAKLRSIMDTAKPETKDLGPPPPYPTLAPISEEPEEDVNVLLKKVESPTAPKQYLPGMFGPYAPFGPFGPVGPVVDPSMFIAKKTAFLDTLFKNIATSTPSLSSTEIPTAKSTIVPPNFWLPSSVIPSPMEYNDKVSEFLDKLFDTLKLNKTTATSDDDSVNLKNDLVRSIVTDGSNTEVKIARSVDDFSSINSAKDLIVSSILSELGDLKGDMVTTMNDLISYEKSTLSPKKPFKPFGPGPWAKPTTDGMFPFQQKMAVLSQVFDMLTDLQKNITLAVQDIIKAKIASTNAPAEAFNANYPLTNDILSSIGGLPTNMSLLDAIKHKLDTLDYGVPPSYNPSYNKFGLQAARSLPKNPASFSVSYPEDAISIKREVDSDVDIFTNEQSNPNRKQARSVKMQMHQGYQSLPAGSIESVQAGGGSTPGHQGGGIKLLDANDYEDYYKWANWMEYLRNDNRGHRHHNHH
ncbi:hypothetical protein QLX08_002710 [Tetragonisca angustula]|uniref:Uncharacterized protein n=1 Tax=Tetragonisca angustula TaxID=166442 RepID=A0AAW1ACH9_9HYME